MEATVTTMLDKGKKSLETLLREKAYSDIEEKLEENGIVIAEVSDTDIEALVADRVNEMRNGLKSFAVGSAVALFISSMIGV